MPPSNAARNKRSVMRVPISTSETSANSLAMVFSIVSQMGMCLLLPPHRHLTDDVFVLSAVFANHEWQVFLMNQFEAFEYRADLCQRSSIAVTVDEVFCWR